MDARSYTLVVVKGSIARGVISNMLAMAIGSYILYVVLTSIYPTWGQIIFLLLLSILVGSYGLWILYKVRMNNAIERIAEDLKRYGYLNLLGGRVEICRARIEGSYRRRSYITLVRIEKLGESQLGIDMRDLGRLGSLGAIIAVRGDEGVLIGDIYRVAGVGFKNLLLIPIFPSLPMIRVEEKLGEGEELATFSLELGGCGIKGSIISHARSRARSYRVEMRLRDESLYFSKEYSVAIYRGEPGSFIYNLQSCNPLLILAWQRPLDLRDIISAVRKAIGGYDRELLIGYREGVLTLSLIIDIPFAKDIVRRIVI
ncbi:MAG: hypothetical protein QXE01_04380 [Sulfolobales archaeon]